MFRKSLKVIKHILRVFTVVVVQIKESAIQNVRIIKKDTPVIMENSCAHRRIVSFVRI